MKNNKHVQSAAKSSVQCTLTWEQKLEALNSLGEAHLVMRTPGDWYLLQSKNIGGGGRVASSSFGFGKTPQEAVENDWLIYTEGLPSDRYVVCKHGEKVRWNGFMWKPVP
jgi:hypothetical protein